MTGLQLCCEFSHLERKVVLPEVDGFVIADGFVGPFGCTPELAEVVELADVGRLMASGPVGGDALEIGGQAVGVADECDALALRGEPAGLLHGEKGLAAARSPADLHTVKELDGVQEMA